MNIGSLIVEVTRKCNISCQHCLRGEAVNMNMKKEYVDTLLSQVDNINSLVFSGGEPTLNLPLMEYFLEVCKHRRIDIGFFYIATNGKKITKRFIMFCLDLFNYCSEKDECSVQISNDMFHRDECDYDIKLLEGLKFFSKKFEKDGYDYNNWSSLKTEGRMENRMRRENKPIVIDENCINPEYFENDVDVYLNCKGEIINGCDWSYKSQKEHKLCDVGELSKYYQELIDEQVCS